MCAPASLIITKQGVKWSLKSDSHDEIIREFGLKDEVAGKITLVRVEITPPDGDMRVPTDQWAFRVDQDLLPDWYTKHPEKWEAEARAALEDWHKSKVFLSGHHEIRGGNCWAYNNSQVTAYDNSQVTAYDNSQVTAYSNSQVTAYNNSQVTAYDNSQVTAGGNSQVTAYNNSQVTAYSNSQVTAGGNSTVNGWGFNKIDLQSPTAVLIDRRVYGKIKMSKGK